MRTNKPLLESEAGEVSSWLLIAAVVAAAALLAASMLQATVGSLADQIAQSAGLAGSAPSTGQPSAFSFPTTPRNPSPLGQPGHVGGASDGEVLGSSLPTVETEGLTMRSSIRSFAGASVLLVEISEEDGTVTDLPPIALRRANRDGSSGGGGASGDASSGSSGGGGASGGWWRREW